MNQRPVPSDTMMNRPLLCECGHAARGHGPRLGEDFHQRCWFCPCDQFVALVLNLDDEDIWVSTTVVAQELKVSPSWVRRHGYELGGTQPARNRPWMFRLATAIEWGLRLIFLSNRRPTVIHHCSRCNTREVFSRGALGYEVVEVDHLPGGCP